MADRDDVTEIAEIDFEVGHTSIIRDEPNTNYNPPRTHDWRVYLRSTDVKGDLNCLIKRCVFNLHPDFPNPKRELKETPFAIQESGYGGFDLYIDIFFKTRKEPKQFRIQYDLNLHTNAEGDPHRQKESYMRKYRWTFSNPDPKLRQKIIAAGGRIRAASPLPSVPHESDGEEEQIPVVPSPTPPPPPKRPFSPAPTSSSKKIKVEPSLQTQKKKPPAAAQNLSKSTVTSNSNKKAPLTSSNKPLPVVAAIKESNESESSCPSLVKSRPSSAAKIKVEPSTTKKKESMIPSPSKSSTAPALKKPLSVATSKATSQKGSVKVEGTSTLVKSPSNVPSKAESSPNPLASSNSSSATVLISSLKKIPKKVIPPPPPPPPPVVVVEKRARSPMTPPSSHRHSAKNSKRDRPPSTSVNNSSSGRSSNSSKHSAKARSRSRSRSRNRSHHHSSRSHHSSRHSSQAKDRSTRHSSHHLSSSSKVSSARHLTPSIHTPQSRPEDSVEAPVLGSTSCSPSVPVFHSEDDHTQTPMDIDGQTDEDETHLHRSIVAHEPVKVPSSHRNFQSDHSSSLSDTNESGAEESDLSLDEDYELPSVLTDADLRSKLIHIYNRFSSNSAHDLRTFVTFFQRHQLIDTSSSSLSKSTDGMVTYDLFALSAPLIEELASDLGYPLTSNALEQ